MICPKCGHEFSAVVRTDDNEALPFVRRGRYCNKCERIYETIETATGAYWHKKNNDITLDLFEHESKKENIKRN